MDFYSSQETYKITRKIYAILRNYPGEIILKRMRGRWGLYEYKTHTMSLDYRRAMIPTLIHECLHHWHPEWSETKVEEEESKIVNSLSPRQILNIMRAFLEAMGTLS